MVDIFVKPAVIKKIDQNQFGTIPNSSTVHALISMLHEWNGSTDGNGGTTRVVLFDFRKAFDLIDHHLLVQKLKTYDLPPWTIDWITDFITCRKQRVKLNRDCYSDWELVPAGVPQGTILGPWLFIIMMNDIEITSSDNWKYVDDTTISEYVNKGEMSNIQSEVDEFTAQAQANKFQFNEGKCKELRIGFSSKPTQFDPISINDKSLEVVDHAKILGLHVSNDLKWNKHVNEITKKARKRLYFLSQLKRSNVATKELLLFYITCIRPVVEYASPVFHDSLTQFLSNDLELIQKRAMKVIFPKATYDQALNFANIHSLKKRRQDLTDKLFHEITSNEDHRLNSILPSRNFNNFNLRNEHEFNIHFQTQRFKNSFIVYNSLKA